MVESNLRIDGFVELNARVAGYTSHCAIKQIKGD